MFLSLHLTSITISLGLRLHSLLFQGDFVSVVSRLASVDDRKLAEAFSRYFRQLKGSDQYRVEDLGLAALPADRMPTLDELYDHRWDSSPKVKGQAAYAGTSGAVTKLAFGSTERLAPSLDLWAPFY